MTISASEIRQLEILSDRTWPALERTWLDGWLLRASEGLTRRSNSATPIDRSREPLVEKVIAVEEWFARRELPAIIRLTPLADPALDDVLDGRGYARDAGADIMTRAVDAGAGPAEVRLEHRVSERWLAGLPTSRGTDTMRRMLETIGDAAYASIEEDHHVVAVGMGVAESEWIAIFNMHTVPGYRRRGAGRSILDALLAWAAGRGAERAMLQVHPESHAAGALYRGAGFEKRYEYRYRELNLR